MCDMWVKLAHSIIIIINLPNSAFSDFVPFSASNKELSTDWAHECIHLSGWLFIHSISFDEIQKRIYVVYIHSIALEKSRCVLCTHTPLTHILNAVLNAHT